MNGTNTYPAFGRHPLSEKDKLCNPELEFAIGIVFGDSDFLGSEGSDEIIKTSKFFKSGES
jgi:hypothetical protein